jgi:hypothetical protein
MGTVFTNKSPELDPDLALVVKNSEAGFGG